MAVDYCADTKMYVAGAIADSGYYTKPMTGIPASDIASGVIPSITGKADKVSSATAGNLAALDANGNLADSGVGATDAEAYSIGTRDGVDVGSTDPAYHNNAKYYANQTMSGTPDGYANLVDDVSDLKSAINNLTVGNPSINNVVIAGKIINFNQDGSVTWSNPT